jgi:hypothetical protein
MSRPAFVRLILGLALLAARVPTPTLAAPSARCFPETGFCIAGPFLAYWETRGGLAAFGYPIPPEGEEKLEDHHVYTVQYFERARFEYHPEHAGTPNEVQLGRLGRYHREPTPPTPHDPGARWFPETGHAIAPPFVAHWEACDGLATLGYPLTGLLPPGPDSPAPTQWFERGRLEWYPARPAPGDVGVSRLGAWIVAAREDRGAPGIAPRPGLFAPDEPSFAPDDARRFLEDWWAAHPDAGCPPGSGGPVRSCPGPPFPPRGAIASIAFLTSGALARRTQAWQSFADERLLCAVTLVYPDRDRPTLAIFDAHTGRGAATLTP